MMSTISAFFIADRFSAVAKDESPSKKLGIMATLNSKRFFLKLMPAM